MGNQHSASHATLKPRKNVHWKSAGKPAVPGKPEIVPLLSEDEPNAITLRWTPAAHDGGAPMQGYQVECNRLGSADWIRTAPPIVARPELVLTGLEPPHRYQFRVAALNVVGRSDYSEISDILNVSSDRSHHDPPIFMQHLDDVTTLENDKTEFRVTFTGTPSPTIAWFKDDYEIFSSRRTAITTGDSSSVLIFHQTLPSDEGEIKCTATNRAGHAVTKAHLSLEAAPKLRYPRQYEDGLLYEINETVFLKTTIVGKPTPTIDWRHDGLPIVPDDRVEITNTPKFSMLKIHAARRSDRGEYQVHAKNVIGEDTAAFLVTITAPPDPPRRVSVARQVDKSVTLDWEPPEDDGGCRIGNYVIEYYRSGWNVWLKATTSRKTNVTLFDLIEGSEYRFRVKAESPYGMSAPSVDSAPVKIPGRAVDFEFLEVESRIINQVLTKEDGEEARVSPAPRRKRIQTTTQATMPPSSARDTRGSNEFMLVLCPENKTVDTAEKRKSFQLDLEDALSPPPISFSAIDISSRSIMPFKALRNAVSSTELLHERAMERFYKVVAMKEEQTKINPSQRETESHSEQPKPYQDRTCKPNINNIPYNTSQESSDQQTIKGEEEIIEPPIMNLKGPQIFIKTDSVEGREFKYSSRPVSQDSETASDGKWQQMSFDEDYTASTVSSEGEYSDEGSLNGNQDRIDQYNTEEETYHPRDKMIRQSPLKESADEEESEREILKPLPLPDPNFIPKPILKRRDSETNETKPISIIEPLEVNKPKEPKKESKLKKDEKLTIFKKITKMPVQKPFAFPKLLNKKENSKKTKQPILITQEQPKVDNKKIERVDDIISDEGRTVIDYYGSLVKEYGGQKKPAPRLYLDTQDLKSVAEKQQSENNDAIVTKKSIKTTTKVAATKKKASKPTNAKTKPLNSVTEPKSKTKASKSQLENKHNEEAPDIDTPPKKYTQKIVLKTTERATIVIPIDYQELEEKAKVNVRSAIDYVLDMCLLLLAFWVYFFKDERLAIPFLILIIYRQLQETLFFNIPEWIRSHTPGWIKRKTS